MNGIESIARRTEAGGAAGKTSHLGSRFDDALAELGIREEVTAAAMEQVLAWQIEEARKAAGITRVEMARRMRTSRTELARLLDPTNPRVQLDTLQRAEAVGRRLVVDLV